MEDVTDLGDSDSSNSQQLPLWRDLSGMHRNIRLQRDARKLRMNVDATALGLGYTKTKPAVTGRLCTVSAGSQTKLLHQHSRYVWSPGVGNTQVHTMRTEIPTHLSHLFVQQIVEPERQDLAIGIVT